MKVETALCLVAAATTASSATASARPKQQVYADIRDAPITRQGSSLLLAGNPWKAVGGNVYWLGLDENVTPLSGEPFYAPSRASYPTRGRVTEAMAMIRAMGGTSIRSHTLGVSTGNPLSLMPALGEINPQAFETIDWAVYQARQYGLRLLVPLTDNYDYYHGGKYNFLRWHGLNLTQKVDSNNPVVQQFFTNSTIVSSFKEYIRTLVTHVNPYTNLSYAEDPTIWAYETGNELCGPVWGDENVPAAWVREIGQFIKSLAPQKLFVDGTYGVNASHLGIPEVDVYSDHFYPVDVQKLRAGIALVTAANKTYLAGEYGWTESKGSAGDSLSPWFNVLEQSPGAIGSKFWSLFGHDVPNCNAFVNHSDGFTLQYGNPSNSARTNASISLIRAHLIRMSRGSLVGAETSLPSVPCPAPVQVPGVPGVPLPGTQV